MATGYRPELGISNELNSSEAAYYQSLIGILRWIVELGRPDICVEVSKVTSHMVMPRRGHLDQIYHIFGYLNKSRNSKIVFDPTPPEIPDNPFQRHGWRNTVYSTAMKNSLPMLLNLREMDSLCVLMSISITLVTLQLGDHGQAL